MEKNNIESKSIEALQPVDNIEDIYPLSDIEKGMIYFQMKDTDTSLFHIQSDFYLKRNGFEKEIFKKAFALMVDKHPILRTGFNMDDFEEPIQIVKKKVPINIEYHDIPSYMGLHERKQYIKQLLAMDRQQPFDISGTEQLWRMKLINFDEDTICLLWITHHAIIDGWSSASFIKELTDTYAKVKSNPNFVPRKLKSTYKEFVIEQIREKKRSENHEFWRKELNDYKRLTFPETLINPDVNKMSKHCSINLGISTFQNLNKLSKKINISVKHICFAAYFYMLSMLSYEEDIVVGLTSNCRPLCEDGDKIIGCFLNTIPVRMKIPSKIKWLTYIRMMDKKLLQLKEYERLPFLDIVGVIGEKTHDQNPIFDCLFNFTNFYISSEIMKNIVQKVSREPKIVEMGIKRNKLFNFAIESTFRDLRISLSYDNSMLDDDLTLRLCSYFENILNKFIYEADSIICKEDLFSRKEKLALFHDFNNTAMEFPSEKRNQKEKTAQMIFEEQVDKFKDRVAVSYKEQQLTYKALNGKANQLARLLRAKEIGQESVVGLITERSIEMIVGIMAILKSGAAYLPVDTKLPTARKRFMLEENTPGVILIQRHLLDQNKELLEGWSSENVILIDDRTIFKGNSSNLVNINKANDPIYVIYTSGTTGKPNGIISEHRNVINFISGLEEQVFKRYSKNMNFSLLSPYSFDGSIRMIFGALLYGHGLFLIPEETRTDGRRLIEFYKKYRIDISDGVPAHIQIMVESLNGMSLTLPVKNFIIAGELLAKRIVKTFLNSFETNPPEISNGYGATECCGFSTLFAITKENIDSFKNFPVGKPLPNEQVFIVDKNLSLQPIGVFGELCISGDCVTRGYLKREELTCEKFVSHPFIDGKQMYRTGDLARWLADGNIEFLGRIDRQVKIHGYRIELEEVENQLVQHPAVKEAVVIKKETSSNNLLLCAYITEIKKNEIEENFLISLLKEYLAKKLPTYFIPSRIVRVDSIKRKLNGKVDYDLLPDVFNESGIECIPPENDTEKKLIEIWSEILGVEKIGRNSHFFELGGNSINLVSLVTRIHKEFAKKIPINKIFANQTIEKQGKMVMKAGTEKFNRIVVSEKKDFYPLFESQHQLYTIQHLDMKNTAYNMPNSLILEGKLDRNKLEQVFKKIIKRHECLRTSFVTVGSEPVQRVHDNVKFTIEHYSSNEKAEQKIVTDFIRSFDLSKAPLLRVGLIKISEKKYIIMLDTHHIITDGISMSIFINEIIRLYRGEELRTPRIQYKDYLDMKRRVEKIETLKEQEKYWLNEFKGDVQTLNLPYDYARPQAPSFAGDSVNFNIEKEEIKRLRLLAAEEEVTLFILLLSTFYVLLAKISGQEDIVIGSPISNRRHSDTEQMMGLFAQNVALRNNPQEEKTFKGFLKEVKEKALAAFENQDFPFLNIIKKVCKNRVQNRNPIFDVMFNLINIEFPEIVIPGLKIMPYIHKNMISKVDLILNGIEQGESLFFSINYKVKLFKRETIDRIIDYYRKIISGVVSNPDKKISDIKISINDNREDLLSQFEDDLENE